MNTFSHKSLISSAWQSFKANWKFLVLAIVATGIVQMILQMIQNGSQRAGFFGSLIAALVVGIVGIIITLGWTRVTLAINRSHGADWETFKTQPKVWLQYVKAMVWYFLYFIMYAVIGILPALVAWGITRLAAPNAMVLGMIFGIIMAVVIVIIAIYMGIRYQFIGFVVLDNPKLRSRDAFKKSGELTKGYFWKLFLFGILLGLINLVGLICLVVGLLVTIPLTKLAKAHAYDWLKAGKGIEPVVIVEETIIVEETVA